MRIDIPKLCALLDEVADIIIQKRSRLTELDAAIGDGDFGTSLSTGFRKVKDQLPQMEKESTGEILKKVAITLTSSVGGVSGTIWGTAFLRAGMKAGDKKELDADNILEMMDAALEGIKARGKAEPGEKTLIDALHPAIEEFRKVREEGGSLVQAFERAAAAARNGSDATVDMVAKKGRASYLGERTKGHRDAGSWAIVLVFDTLTNTLKQMEETI